MILRLDFGTVLTMCCFFFIYYYLKSAFSIHLYEAIIIEVLCLEDIKSHPV